jgi:hypothetical protein
MVVVFVMLQTIYKAGIWSPAHCATDGRNFQESKDRQSGEMNDEQG